MKESREAYHKEEGHRNGSPEKYRVAGKQEILSKQEVLTAESVADMLVQDGQRLLPLMLDLIVNGKEMVDRAIDIMGTGMIQGMLELSCRQIAGAPRRGARDHADNAVHRYGYQHGVVGLSDRKLRVKKPRLRTRTKTGSPSKEVPIPAYESLKSNPGVGEHILRLLARGVSTRDYKGTLEEMAGTLGVSKSAVSREFITRTETSHAKLMARRFDDIDIVVIYIDGMMFGEHHVITALGLDRQGKKHVLGIKGAGSENSQAIKELLTGIVERGVKPEVKRLFIIDGGKAIRRGIDEVFGSEHAVQRCTIHKVRNVQEQLPEEKRAYAKMKILAAVQMPADKGLAELRAYAKELDVSHAAAAGSMREGLEELLTVSRLGITGPLAKSLLNTNVIESSQSLIGKFSGRVKRWGSLDMAVRWHATACLDAEERMRAVRGKNDMSALVAALRPEEVRMKKAG